MVCVCRERKSARSVPLNWRRSRGSLLLMDPWLFPSEKNLCTGISITAKTRLGKGREKMAEGLQ